MGLQTSALNVEINIYHNYAIIVVLALGDIFGQSEYKPNLTLGIVVHFRAIQLYCCHVLA